MAEMRNIWILALALAACSAGAPDPSPESNAAVESGSAPAPVPTTSSAVADVPPPADALPDATPSPSPAPSAEPSDAALLEDGPEQSADAARQVVRRYYALIGRGDHAAAYALWDDGGRASGMSAAAFAQSFARYARYDAAVGRPRRVEGGAGQRYVEVPVALRGTLKDGSPFAMRGTVTLHRAGPIDGATAEQRRWRIARADIRPHPAEAATPSATSTPFLLPASRVARYRCGDGSLMLVRFDNAAGTADVELGGSLLGKLDGQRPGSGIWYTRGPIELRGKGREATLTRPDAPDLHCTAQD